MRCSFIALINALLASLTFLAAAPLEAGTVQYVYDNLGRLIAAVDEAGNATTYVYDAAGNLLSVNRTAANQLAVIAFSPDYGKVGDSITIIGSRFVPSPGVNEVSFNGVSAAILSATATTIQVSVPAGATTGPVTVTNANGSATSTASFTVLSAAVITSVSPQFVQRGAETRVTIIGAHLAHASGVTFDAPGITSTIAAGRTEQSLPVRISVTSNVEPGQYPFMVTTPAGSSASGSVLITVAAGPLGETLAHGAATSVYLAPGPSSPVGEAAFAAQPTSVHLPASGAPSGEAAAVAAPLSVSMP